MLPVPGRSSASAPTIRLDRSSGAIVVQSPEVFGPGGEALRDQFLVRVLAVAEVQSVSIDRRRATATLRPVDGPSGLPGLLPRLAAALRGHIAPLPLGALPGGIGGARFTIRRYGTRLTTWEPRHDGPGRLRLRHEAARRDRVRLRRVERLLAQAPGVTWVRPDGWTGRLVVAYDPGRVEAEYLVYLAERALEDPDAVPALALAAPAAPARLGLASTMVGVATLADLGVTALMPVSAALLVGTNLRTLREAADQLRRRELGLSVLYATIIVGTLASGQFLASALMSWMVRYWRRRHHDELAAEQQLLLEDYVSLPTAVRLAADGPDVVVSRDRLRPGDRVAVRAGEIIPADGLVVAGEAVVDERNVRGLDGVSRKRAGAPALAGSTVLLGRLQVEVGPDVERTRAAAIGRALLGAIGTDQGRPAITVGDDSLAKKAVGPTLATAAVGLTVGDLTTAVAILRPDYATGPRLSGSLEALGDLARCLDRGIVVRDVSALDRLRRADVLVLADHPWLRQPELQVARVESQLSEVDELLRFAGSLGRYLPDDRGTALAAACRSQGIPLRNLVPVDWSDGIAVRHGRHLVRLRDLGEGADAGPVAIEVDGRQLGTFEFCAATEPAAAAVLGQLRGRGRPPRIVLASERPGDQAAALARDLGIVESYGGLSGEDLARLLRDFRDRGLRVAFVGDGVGHARATAEADVAVSLVGDGDLDASPAPILLLQPSLSRLVDLWDIAEARVERARATRNLTLVPNLACVAGALFFGFTSLTVVVISNLGTYGHYARASRSLRFADRAGRTWRRPLSIPRRGASQDIPGPAHGRRDPSGLRSASGDLHPQPFSS